MRYLPIFLLSLSTIAYAQYPPGDPAPGGGGGGNAPACGSASPLCRIARAIQGQVTEMVSVQSAVVGIIITVILITIALLVGRTIARGGS